LLRYVALCCAVFTFAYENYWGKVCCCTSIEAADCLPFPPPHCSTPPCCFPELSASLHFVKAVSCTCICSFLIAVPLSPTFLTSQSSQRAVTLSLPSRHGHLKFLHLDSLVGTLTTVGRKPRQRNSRIVCATCAVGGCTRWTREIREATSKTQQLSSSWNPAQQVQSATASCTSRIDDRDYADAEVTTRNFT
jgi:hypothetical protein